jgi:hypothetical protein
MKDGTVAETGTHEELMLKNGKYAELYNIQASAFSADASTEGETKSEVSTFPSPFLVRTSLTCDTQGAPKRYRHQDYRGTLHRRCIDLKFSEITLFHTLYILLCSLSCS